MTKEQSGGRRTRRVNAWAKAAGEYYRSHKNDSDIQDFSDVLKSPKFKAYYHSKYGKKKSQPSFNSTRKASKGRSRSFNKFDEEEDMEEDMEEEKEIVYKGKKGKGKARKEVDDWSWGFDKKNFKEEENQEGKKKQRFQKNELFNGGKKGKKGGNNNQQQQQNQQQQNQQQQQQQQQQNQQQQQQNQE